MANLGHQIKVQKLTKYKSFWKNVFDRKGITKELFNKTLSEKSVLGVGRDSNISIRSKKRYFSRGE